MNDTDAETESALRYLERYCKHLRSAIGHKQELLESAERLIADIRSEPTEQPRPLPLPQAAPQQPDGPYARLGPMAATKALMTDREGEWLKASDAAKGMKKGGWRTTAQSPSSVVRTNLLRLAQRGFLEQSTDSEGVAIYRVPPKATPTDKGATEDQRKEAPAESAPEPQS